MRSPGARAFITTWRSASQGGSVLRGSLLPPASQVKRAAIAMARRTISGANCVAGNSVGMFGDKPSGRPEGSNPQLKRHRSNALLRAPCDDFLSQGRGIGDTFGIVCVMFIRIASHQKQVGDARSVKCP
jgi:hypothetical protein